MRLTFNPQGWVAWSTATSTLALISSRFDSDSSRSSEPIDVRMFVITRLRIAISSVATSYAALAASSTWKNTTPSTLTTALSLVMTSCDGTSSTCSIMLILRPTL
jgi:hypothetical protein